MYGYIYITTNLINNKKYIGKHRASEYDETYRGSGTTFLRALNKYGFDNFKTEVLCECDTLDELNKQEKSYIDAHNAVKNRNYYNLKDGGDGGGTPGTRYITNGTQCKLVRPDELDYYLSNGYHLGGPKQTDETKIKRANANRGKKHPTAGAKISKAMRGKKISAETSAHLSEIRKGCKPHNNKSVLCIETNEVYSSLKEATLKNGYVSSGNLCSCLKCNRDTAFGLHWKYVD